MNTKKKKFLYYTMHVLCGAMILMVILATILGEGDILMWCCTALMVSNVMAVRTIKKQDDLIKQSAEMMEELLEHSLSLAESMLKMEDSHERGGDVQ